jgi:hypothetical protein
LILLTTKNKAMNKQDAVQKFCSELAAEEAGKSNAKIGDIRQLVRLADKKLNGGLYTMIQLKYEETEPQSPEPAYPVSY